MGLCLKKISLLRNSQHFLTKFKIKMLCKMCAVIITFTNPNNMRVQWALCLREMNSVGQFVRVGSTHPDFTIII